MIRNLLVLALTTAVCGDVIYPKVSGNPVVNDNGLKMLVIKESGNEFRYHYGAFGLCTEDFDAALILRGYAKFSLDNNGVMYKQKYTHRCSDKVDGPVKVQPILEKEAGDVLKLLSLVQKINQGSYDFKEYASGDCHPALEVNGTDTVRSVASGSTLLPLHPNNKCVRSEIDEIGIGKDGSICVQKSRYPNNLCQGTPTNIRTKLYNKCFNKDHSTFADYISFVGFTAEDLQQAVCLHGVVDSSFKPTGTCGDITWKETAEKCRELGHNIPNPPSESSTSTGSILLIMFLIFFTLVFLYCCIGAAWRYHHGGKGLDLIPHMESIKSKGWFQVPAATGEAQSELDFVEDESAADLPATPIDAIDESDVRGDTEVEVSVQ
eukprot:TRINITY_DN4019_c0_g1_i1.p1 TRINITY_DN4019_c0_g1~~TRINITY_DN4019_c0_g1_i1.p1  ORF type:complete len:398 (+),score=74.96 TRINITY_DN4019_c0_g1_i1:63-1196(+)